MAHDAHQHPARPRHTSGGGAVLKRIWALLDGAERRSLLALVPLVLITAVFELVGVSAVIPFVTLLADPSAVYDLPIVGAWLAGLGVADPTELLRYAGIALALAVLATNAMVMLTRYRQLRFAARLNATMATRLLQHYLAQPYAFTLTRNSADLTNTVNAQVGQVTSAIGVGLNLLTASVTVVALLTFLVLLDPLLALASFGALTATYALIYVSVRRFLTRSSRERVALSAQRFKAVQEAMGGFKDLKVAGREAHAAALPHRGRAVRGDRHARQRDQDAAALRARGHRRCLGHRGCEPDGRPRRVVRVDAAGARRLRVRRLAAAARDAEPLQRRRRPPQRARRHRTRRRGRARGPRIARRARRDARAAPLPARHRARQRQLPLPRRRRASAARHRPAPREGPQPCHRRPHRLGQKQLVNVVLGLLAPDHGSLCVDGVSVTSENRRAYRRLFGYVPQDIFLVDDTLRRNVALGIPDDEIDDEAVRRACRQAQVDEFIEHELPLGYETVVGERGIRLSGGQRQRIGIARALYHQPPILVFDEATSALDVHTARRVFDALDAIAKERTLVMIAHRLETVMNADTVVVLEGGRVVDRGQPSSVVRQYREVAV